MIFAQRGFAKPTKHMAQRTLRGTDGKEEKKEERKAKHAQGWTPKKTTCWQAGRKPRPKRFIRSFASGP